MTRTIVVSDLHGRIAPLERALEHSGFGMDDRLVVAGDLIDVGSEDALSYAESVGATILAGNHEVSAAIGLRISPQNAESLVRGPEFAEHMTSGRWKLAHVADGHLITHAGVSSAFSDVITRHPDLDDLAAELNASFAAEIAEAVARKPLTWEDLERFRLLGSSLGPLWFRPFATSQLPSGIRQIVGHTAPELLPGDLLAAVRSAGWLLVEPGGRDISGTPVDFRYAVVADGRAQVFEG